ncbi:membrane protein FxsA [Bacillus sp. ISL-47]|uniref:FxsA family protein n=1 Tax=Bacillus sp. ISL-47 TaxID=2819130 RepID=UPI001BEC1A25|nr:FxsA family protein [Bacillus sp. ISL-47]MBT2689359.1 membrane protein FxsA [Bacillus sp. ISL-47]MBT2706345.1 membrane protein FxsA [Pseudomonas sp. ISL-84]
MRYILLLLIIVPAAEIGILLLSGNTIGLWPTLAIIIFTGILGAYLAKKQGLETIRKLQDQLQYGQMPGDTILDGVCILVGGTLLLTPGFITDAAGFTLLAPPTRRLYKKILLIGIRKWMNKGTITIIR